MEARDPPRARLEGVGTLGIDPALDAVADHLHVLLLPGQRQARGDPDLLFDEIDAGDLFGDGMLDLDPRSEEHTSELQSRLHLVCRLLLEKKKKMNINVGATGTSSRMTRPTKQLRAS